MGTGFKTFVRGKYSDKEKELLENDQKAIERVPIGTISSVKRVPDLRSYARAWDPYNPLFNDQEYAKTTRYGDIIAFPGLIDPMGMFPMLSTGYGDYLYFANDGGDVELFEPIFEGDTFESENKGKFIEDITEDGSELRSFRMWGNAEVYNQHSKLVGKGAGGGRNSFRSHIDPADKPVHGKFHTIHDWIDYLWPIHVTTDEEWEYIVDMWKNEKIRGRDVLYWEDVNVGDEPWPTITNPITYLDMMRLHDAGRFLPTVRELLTEMPEDMCRMLLETGDNGLRFMSGAMHFGNIGFAKGRAAFYNNTARNFIFRMITNWMGDDGFIRKYSWRFCQLFKEMRIDKAGSEFLEKVPHMNGRGCERHGMEGDAVLCKGYVTEKYKQDAEHLIDVACWGETLDGEIVQIAPVTIRLKSRNDKA